MTNTLTEYRTYIGLVEVPRIVLPIAGIVKAVTVTETSPIEVTVERVIESTHTTPSPTPVSQISGSKFLESFQ